MGTVIRGKDGSVLYRSDSAISAGLGCLAIAAVIGGVYFLVVAVFTVLYNAVVPGIFNLGPTLDLWQGALVVLFLSVVAGFFKTSVSN